MDAIQEFGYIVALEEFNTFNNNFNSAMESDTNIIEKLLKNAWELIKRAIKAIIDVIGNLIKIIKRKATGGNVYMKRCDIEYTNLMMDSLKKIDAYINNLPELDKELRMSNANDLMDDVNNILANVVEECKNIDAISCGNIRISNPDENIATFNTDAYATKFTDLRNKWSSRLHKVEHSPYLHGSIHSPKQMYDNDDSGAQQDSYTKLMHAGRHIAVGMQKTYNQALKATGVVSKFIDEHMKTGQSIKEDHDKAKSDAQDAVERAKKKAGI